MAGNGARLLELLTDSPLVRRVGSDVFGFDPQLLAPVSPTRHRQRLIQAVTLPARPHRQQGDDHRIRPLDPGADECREAAADSPKMEGFAFRPAGERRQLRCASSGANDDLSYGAAGQPRRTGGDREGGRGLRCERRDDEQGEQGEPNC